MKLEAARSKGANGDGGTCSGLAGQTLHEMTRGVAGVDGMGNQLGSNARSRASSRAKQQTGRGERACAGWRLCLECVEREGKWERSNNKTRRAKYG